MNWRWFFYIFPATTIYRFPWPLLLYPLDSDCSRCLYCCYFIIANHFFLFIFFCLIYNILHTIIIIPSRENEMRKKNLPKYCETDESKYYGKKYPQKKKWNSLKISFINVIWGIKCVPWEQLFSFQTRIFLYVTVY